MEKIKVGDLYADKDSRHKGRVVKVVAISLNYVVVETTVHPKRPTAVGKRRQIHRSTLEARYEEVSH